MKNQICEWMGLEVGTVEYKLECIRQEFQADLERETAMVYFGAYNSTSNEWQEDNILPGEMIDDYDFTMAEMFA